MSKVYPNGTSGNITVAATHSIAVRTNGVAKVFQIVGYPNYPTTRDLIATVENEQVVLGAYASGATIVIEAEADEVYYATGAQPAIDDLPDTIEILGGDSGKVSNYNVAALAGNGVRQGIIAISLGRADGEDFTWDGNPDCAIKITVRNHADNAANEGAARGIDISARNSGANMSWCNGGSINARNDSGSTTYSLWGIMTRIENYGTCETEAVGIDVNMSMESDTGAPDTYAIRVRNTDASSQPAIDAVLAVSNTSTNGFTHFLDVSGLTAANGTLISTSGSAATNWAGRLRVLDASGTAAWINIYSTSNEA